MPVFQDLPEWERDLAMAEVRRIYIYSRSAAQRALTRVTSGTSWNTDAVLETLWWVGACDGYLHTVFGNAWVAHKTEQPFSDLINAHLWARNQTIHDPFCVVPMFERFQIVEGELQQFANWHWAPRTEIPIANCQKENQNFALAYDRALAGRIMFETLDEVVEVLRRHVRPDDVAARAIQ